MSASEFDQQMAVVLGCTENAVRKKRQRRGLLATNADSNGHEPEEDRAVRVLKEKEKIRKYRDSTALRLGVTREARLGLLEEYIEQAAQKLSRRRIIVAPPRKKAPPTHEQEAMVLISDVQIGQWVDEEAVGGLARYDMAIFEERAQILKQKVERIIRLHQTTHPINRLHVLLNGDMVEGHKIFKGQAAELDATVVDQTIRGADVFHRLIAYWSGLVDEVVVTGVYGNHGKVSYEAAIKDNWDYVMYRFIEQLGMTDGLENVRYDFPRTWWRVVNSMGRGFLMVHGDDVRGSSGIPFYGAERAEGRLRGMIPEEFDYLLLGHHHRTCIFETNRGEVIFNGNWVGGSTYSLKQHMSTSKPSQLMWGVSEKTGVTWRYKLLLEDV